MEKYPGLNPDRFEKSTLFLQTKQCHKASVQNFSHKYVKVKLDVSFRQFVYRLSYKQGKQFFPYQWIYIISQASWQIQGLTNQIIAKFNILRMVVISCQKPYSSRSPSLFLFSKKLTINQLPVNKVNQDGNTLSLDMGTLFSTKQVEDFTLLFKINNLLIFVKYKWNTWYFLLFKLFTPFANNSLPSNSNISKMVRIAFKTTFLKEYSISFRIICRLIFALCTCGSLNSNV